MRQRIGFCITVVITSIKHLIESNLERVRTGSERGIGCNVYHSLHHLSVAERGRSDSKRTELSETRRQIKVQGAVITVIIADATVQSYALIASTGGGLTRINRVDGRSTATITPSAYRVRDAVSYSRDNDLELLVDFLLRVAGIKHLYQEVTGKDLGEGVPLIVPELEKVSPAGNVPSAIAQV